MLDQVWTTITDALHSNQFLGAGFVLGVLAAILHQCKTVPRKILNWITYYLFVEVDIEDRDESFMWMSRWLAVHPYGQNRARKLMVLTERPDRDKLDAKDRDHRPRVIFTPARGTHWFFYKRRLVLLHRGRDTEGGGGSGDGPMSMEALFKPENMTISVLSRNRDIIKSLLEDARELSHPKGERRTSIMTFKWGDWGATVKRRPRPLESVIFKAGIMEACIKQIDDFLNNEQWYIEHGIPYRLGIEWFGPPGSGKSSGVAAIAAHFDMDLAILNLSAGGVGDDELRNLLANVPQNCIVLIEDIDCASSRSEKKSTDESKITFSGLLNAIDGVAAGEGRILFMTTNYHERLDAALIRPGRIDLQQEIGPPDHGQVCRIFNRFFPDATDSQTLRFVEAVGDPGKTSMAGLQGVLIKNLKDPEQAIKHAHEVVKC